MSGARSSLKLSGLCGHGNRDPEKEFGSLFEVFSCREWRRGHQAQTLAASLGRNAGRLGMLAGHSTAGSHNCVIWKMGRIGLARGGSGGLKREELAGIRAFNKRKSIRHSSLCGVTLSKTSFMVPERCTVTLDLGLGGAGPCGLQAPTHITGCCPVCRRGS